MSELSTGQRHFLSQQKRHKRIVSVSRVLILLSFLFIWEFTANVGIIDSFIFSSPSKIALCFWGMLMDKSIFLHIGVTLYETILSFVLVIAISILMAVALWFSPKLSEILDPYLVVLNSLPKSALAPLLIVWLGANTTTIIVAGMSVAIFGSILNLYTSFTTVDPEKIKLIYTLHGSKFHALTKVVVPSSIPAIISTMKVNIGLCLVGVIIGEFLAARDGLGYLIIYASQTFKLDWLLMSIVLLCIMAMGLYSLINLIERIYLKRV
ncbi:ABC transporter permease [[Clostridium] hylemonae]|uniref:ABC transporter, permease protein n=1 Tax=[Clostridium] hylemonae DSM 15053 TaxID=553973 RepID=C0BWL7_9FIRM|nr:ABC transporter permease [[Clostridium] hylemonae]EEG75699.1 ABC transporter, permease protein [[Clostridium] hylemonae DSM 15053]QEK17827.1 Putative aliphatic sulfonates transport permease protein SsuC [[Clostridium] hylemonae DSM 15053]